MFMTNCPYGAGVFQGPKERGEIESNYTYSFGINSSSRFFC
jgi:hypothetical protein